MTTPGLASGLDTTAPGLASGLGTPLRLLASTPAPLAAPPLQPQQLDSLKTRRRTRLLRRLAPLRPMLPIGRHPLLVFTPSPSSPSYVMRRSHLVAPPVAHPQELDRQPATPQPEASNEAMD